MVLHNRGFAALLLVITLSVTILTALVEVGNSTWRLKQNVILLGDRTQRQLAAESCRQMALLYIAEDPDYDQQSFINLGNDVRCTISSIKQLNNNPSPFADRMIETKGVYMNGTSTMISVVGITNQGLVEKERYFK